VVIAVAGFFFGQQVAEGQIVWQIEGLVGHASAVAIEGMIQEPENLSQARLLQSSVLVCCCLRPQRSSQNCATR
jgi:hypothetical protein